MNLQQHKYRLRTDNNRSKCNITGINQIKFTNCDESGLRKHLEARIIIKS